MRSKGHVIRRPRRLPCAAFFLLAACAAGQEEHAPPQPGDIILTDVFGHAVGISPDQLPANLLPPASVGIERQLPRPAPGRRVPKSVLERQDSGRERTFTLFPAAPPVLAPYLAAQDELGNTAIKPGFLVKAMPLEPLVQGAKYWLGARGLRYQIEQDFIYSGVPDTPSGSPNLGHYSMKTFAKWAVYADPFRGTAGWLSAQVNVQEGLGGAGANQNVQKNLGTLTNPDGNVSGHWGVRVPELAWQQAIARGSFVALAGVVNQGNYIDVNTYANTGRGQFLNSALINSMVLPLPSYNFAVNLQWQPHADFYVMTGATAGNASAGETPWTNFSWQDWSVVTEIGYVPQDFLGLGPGAYRIQPFLAQAGGPTQGGISFNFEQQLGRKSPLAWFGRFGVGGSQVASGASTQVGTGFAVEAPLAQIGILPHHVNDGGGIGFVWSQPSATSKTVYHRNEYVAETFYTMQLFPMMRLEPDLQLVWNPAFNPDPGPFVVVQAQFILVW